MVRKCEVRKGDDDNYLNLLMDYVPGKIDKAWVHTRLFRKSGTDWVTFFLNLNFDLCEFVTQLSGNEMLRSTLELFDKIDPTLKEGCPLKGPINVVEKRGNELVPEHLPPIFPSGDYRIMSRFYTQPNNYTYFESDYIFSMVLEVPNLLRKPHL